MLLGLAPTAVQRAERSHVLWSVAFAALAIILVCVALRLPLQTSYLVNWDAVQFAYATEGFDLEQHRPHPPGYIGYVYAARALTGVVGDANTSLVLMSLAGSAVAPALFLLLALKLLPRGRAYFVTALFATSPLLWYYGGVALTYAPEAALAVAFGLTAWMGRIKPGPWLLAASLLLAITGAVRQTGAVLLLPLWLWAVWPAPWSLRLGSAAVLVSASLAWLVPLIWLSGGVETYVRESVALARSAGAPTSIASGTSSGIVYNWVFVLVSLVAMLGSALLLLLWGGGTRPGVLRSLSSTELSFLLVWLVPALAVFALGHMGQAGYVLVLMPPLFLLIGKLDLAPLLQGRVRSMAMLGGLVAVNALIVFYVPQAVYSQLSPESPAAGQVRQFIPAKNDAYWAKVVEIVERFDPEKTAILTAPGGPNSSAGFRQLSYYLPDYHIYATINNPHLGIGVLYSSHGRTDNYQISDRLPRPALPLQPDVRTVLIVDWMVRDDFMFGFPVDQYRVLDGPSVWVGMVQPGTTLVFKEVRSRVISAVTDRALLDAIPPPRAQRSQFELFAPEQ